MYSVAAAGSRIRARLHAWRYNVYAVSRIIPRLRQRVPGQIHTGAFRQRERMDTEGLGMPPYAPKIWNYASPIMLLKLVIMLLLCSGNAPKNNGIIGIITA